MTTATTRAPFGRGVTRFRRSRARHRAAAEADRLVALICRVTAAIGFSRRSAEKICRELREEGLLPNSPKLTRAERDDVVGALRTALAPRVDTALLDEAVHDAVLLDEYQTLPSTQRDVLWAVLWGRRSVDEVAAELGVSVLEVHSRLREALWALNVNQLPRAA